MTTYYIRSLQNVFLMDCVKSSDKIPRGSNIVAAALVLFFIWLFILFQRGARLPAKPVENSST